ncbi:MAG: glycosyltransferase, partial [Verrucomicrobia bacterium]|nr:glycosyltransferase [Verrucomicrobiota bacterium]
MNDILIGIPTLNEADHVPQMVQRIAQLPIQADLLFVDDSSTDGTGEILDRLAEKHINLKVIHRPPFSGIGSAHRDIISYAYEKGYSILITLDCDFSHQPEDIPKILSTDLHAPVVVGSRFLDRQSLSEWNFGRKVLTHLGHFLTHRVLGLPMDATGAFRLYRLTRIPRSLWAGVSSSGYAFFFESLTVLQGTGITCEEISIHLPKRVYGESKLSLTQAVRSLLMLLQVAWRRESCGEMPNDAGGWDRYWKARDVKGRHWYAVLASIYRRIFIVNRLDSILRNEFPAGASLL